MITALQGLRYFLKYLIFELLFKKKSICHKSGPLEILVDESAQSHLLSHKIRNNKYFVIFQTQKAQ